MMMTAEERLARVEELLARGLKYLTPEQIEQIKAIDAEYEEADTAPQQKPRTMREPHG